MNLLNLVRAEAARLVSRRFALVMLVFLLGALAITFATTVASSHTPSGAELDRARVELVQERQRLAQNRQECLDAQAEGTGRWYGVNCDSYDPDNARLESHLSGVFVFAGSITALVMFLAVFLGLFGFLVGASYLGAELTSGGMTNLLLWRPQRLTVLGTKLGVLLAAVLAVSIPLTLGFVGAFRLLAAVGGFAGDTGGTFYPDLFFLCVRGVALAAGATALGFLLSSVGRHTAAAVGALAAYAVVWEVGGRIVTEMVDTPRAEVMFLGTHLAAWLDGRIELYDSAICDGSYYYDSCSNQYTIHWWQSGPLLTVLLVGALAAAFAIFRRRDLA